MGLARTDRLQLQHWLAAATPIASFDLATRTLFVPQRRDAVDLTLAVACGAVPTTGWRIVTPDGPAFCIVGVHPDQPPLLLAFASPAHDALLIAIARERRFTIQTEGCIPVEIVCRERADDVLRPWLEGKGWLV